MSAAAPVQRHRTAMVRHTLSQPMSLLVRHGLVGPGVAVFDYGCGQGDDLRALAAAGVEARGWDPHFAPDAPRVAAAVVNLGFVLNVIEDADERRRALEGAWALAEGVLAVSTMIAGQVPTDGLKPFRDGFLTSRGTFQKYFAHAELRELVADAVGRDPVAVAPGIFLAFRRGEDQEEFLLRRRMGRRVSTSAYRLGREVRAAAPRPGVVERVAPAIEALASLVRLRGRAPHPDELDAGTLELLARERVAVPRAVDLCMAEAVSPEELGRAAAAMREDLLVHYALARLNRSASVDRPSAAMVRDVRAHFGSQRELQAAATDYLMGLADEGATRAAAADADARGVAPVDHRGRLLADGRRLEDLPGVLRVYLGCASVLAGEPGPDSVVRIDFERRVVEHMRVEGRSTPFPELASEARIDLRRQTVAVQPVRRTLVGKSRVLGARGAAQARREEAYREERGLAPGVLTARVR